MHMTRGRYLPIWTLALLSLTTTGCDTRAREFAEKTALILKQRSEQIAAKIAAETTAYNALAALTVEEHYALVDLSLRNERVSRTLALAADYDEGRKPVSRWQSELAEYGRIDYAANRELLSNDVDARSLFLQKVQALSIEQDRVDALAKLLDQLTKKPKLSQDVGALIEFAEDTKTAFDKKLCDELQKRKDAKDKAAEEALKAKKCP